jgi:hypothetical protein
MVHNYPPIEIGGGSSNVSLTSSDDVHATDACSSEQEESEGGNLLAK